MQPATLESLQDPVSSIGVPALECRRPWPSMQRMGPRQPPRPPPSPSQLRRSATGAVMHQSAVMHRVSCPPQLLLRRSALSYRSPVTSDELRARPCANKRMRSYPNNVNEMVFLRFPHPENEAMANSFQEKL